MASRSIERTLRLTVLLTTGCSLLITSLAFVAYDAYSLRQAMAREADTVARLVGLNTAVPLSFDDPSSASETLYALSAADKVISAVIYDREGRVFARYVSPPYKGSELAVPPVEPPGQRFHSGRLDLFRPIEFGNETIGTVLIRSDTSELATRVRLYSAMVVSVLAIAVLVGIMIASRLHRSILRPLVQLAESAESIAGGDLSAHVAVPPAKELGALAHSFNSMAAGLRGLVAQVRQGIGDVSEVARSLQESSGGMSREVQRQSAAIDETANSVNQLTSSVKKVRKSVDRLSSSASSTAASIQHLDGSIGEIAGNMDQLAEAIAVTSEAVTQVTKSTDSVVESGVTLERATDGALVRLGHLRSAVRQVEDNARESHALSEDSAAAANAGMAAVRETIAAMREISMAFEQLEDRVARLASQSSAIEAIVQVISGVAEETKLLSLNASIIAAQSGEHGRAFTVVAGQVKNLADRTHVSTREIAELIQSVQRDTSEAVAAAEEGSAKVDRGVSRSAAAGEVLEQIMEKSRVSTDRVSEISAATLRQSGDLESVDLAMGEVRSIVAQINQFSRNQHQATAEIAKAVENIRALGERVQRSTGEQRKESGLITNAVANVAAMFGEIAAAVQAQEKSSETIQEALQVFQEVNNETGHRGEELNSVVGKLSDRSKQLEREIGRFRSE